MRNASLRAAKVAWALRRSVPRRALLRHGVLASAEHSTLALRDGYRTVLDVGANRGQFAVFAAASFPCARLYCLEPHPGACTRLERLTTALALGAETMPLAAGARNGTGSLHVSARDDSSSLLPIDEGAQPSMFPGTHEVGRLPVEIRSLDELFAPGELDPPVLLKLDVQGGELAVLQGATRTLERVEDVLIECSFRELYRGQPLASAVLSYLFERDFLLIDQGNAIRDPRGLVQGDYLLRRRPHTRR